MAKTKAIKPVDHVELQQARNMHSKNGMSITAIAKKTGRGQETVKNMLAAKSLSEFKRLQTQRVERDVAARKAKRGNEKKVEAKAAEILAEPREYSPAQTKVIIDGLLTHTANLEERVQTLSSLLVESDDNIVTRLYRLENKRGIVRRFLEKF